MAPSTEGRRSKREIKRPRRYSPDKDVQKSSDVNNVLDTRSGNLVFPDEGDDDDGYDNQNIQNKPFEPVATKKRKLEVVVQESGTKEAEREQNVEGYQNESSAVTEEDQVVGNHCDTSIMEVSEQDNVEGNHGDDDHDMNDSEEENEEGEDADEHEAVGLLLSEGFEDMQAVKRAGGFSCSLCDAKFTTERQCLNHGAKKVCYEDCELCGKQYKKSDLKEYMAHVSLHEKCNKFTCNVCKKVFLQEQHLEFHSRVHQKVKPVKCGKCRFSCFTNFQLAAHTIRKHGNTSDGMEFHCDVCEAKFLKIKFMKFELRFDGELSYLKCIMCSNDG